MRNGRSGGATITDVARAAGVSPATVSRVMNGRFAGADDVAHRVRHEAERLDYSPSPLARSLALGRTQVVAVVVPDLANPAFQEVLAGVSKAAAAGDYRVMVADAAESPTDEPLLAAEVRRRTDAVLLVAPRMDDDALRALARQVAPLVLVNRQLPGSGVPSLSIDYRAGIRELAGHLIGLGHRRLAYLAGPAQSRSNTARTDGLDDVRRAHPDVEVAQVAAGATSEDGRRAAARVRELGATAVLAFNDLVAVGLVGALRAEGLRVPDDVSVTGFDDIPLARYVDPALTTASVSHAELGAQAWSRLHALLTGGEPDPDRVFLPRLEARASTAPPGR